MTEKKRLLEWTELTTEQQLKWSYNVMDAIGGEGLLIKGKGNLLFYSDGTEEIVTPPDTAPTKEVDFKKQLIKMMKPMDISLPSRCNQCCCAFCHMKESHERADMRTTGEIKEEEDARVVAQQANVEINVAKEALAKYEGDIINAIMSLTMND